MSGVCLFCPNRRAHYAAISKSQIFWDPKFEGDSYVSHCPLYRAMQQKTQFETLVLSDKKITALQKLGVHNFKFVGRHFSRDEFVLEVDRVLIKDRFRRYKIVKDKRIAFRYDGIFNSSFVIRCGKRKPSPHGEGF